MIAYIRKCIDSNQSIDVEKFFLPPLKNTQRDFHDNNGMGIISIEVPSM
jgi:hypothetical protein